MTSGDEEYEVPSYYSFTQQNSFECVEKIFRFAQSTLLLYMIFCFIFYLITFGVDIAKLSNDTAYLVIALSIDLLAMTFIVFGVRGVALEIWPYIITFMVAMSLVTVGHSVTFIFRHKGLNVANFFFDATLTLFTVYYTIMLCRFEKLKPADYDLRQRLASGGGGAGGDTEGGSLVNGDMITDHSEITANRTTVADAGTEYNINSAIESNKKYPPLSNKSEPASSASETLLVNITKT